MKKRYKMIGESGYSFNEAKECIIYRDGDRTLRIEAGPLPNHVMWICLRNLELWEPLEKNPNKPQPRENVSEEDRALMIERLKEYLSWHGCGYSFDY